MDQEQIQRMERLEKQNERLEKQNEELKEQMKQLLEAMAGMTRDKMQEEGQTSNQDTPVYPPGFEPTETTQATGTKNTTIAPPQPTMPFPFPPPPPFGAYSYATTGIPSGPGSVPFIPPPITNPIPLYPGLDTTQDEDEEKKKEEERTDKLISMFDERLKMMEGYHYTKAMNAVEATLVPGLVIPPKFKLPDFDKYKGTTDPEQHLMTYVRKMAAHVENDKLMVHCFQDSLTGAASRWYNELDSAKIRTWGDLAKAFLDQYRYILDFVPDRTSLQNMEKRANESFRDYALRWREASVQVVPAVSEKEACSIFMETLKAPYYERLITNTPKSFSDIVTAGERLEKAVKSGKIDTGESSSYKRNSAPRKKEGESNAITNYQPHHYTQQQPRFRPRYQPHYQPTYQPPYQPSYQPPYQPSYLPPYQPYTTNQYPTPTTNFIAATPTFQPAQTKPRPNFPNNYQRPYRAQTPRLHIDPLPAQYTYTQLLPQLIQQGLLQKLPQTMIVDGLPYPKGHDPNARCDYHSGSAGHSTEECKRLKESVQKLINEGKISFQKSAQPNVGQNPLPNHERV